MLARDVISLSNFWTKMAESACVSSVPIRAAVLLLGAALYVLDR